MQTHSAGCCSILLVSRYKDTVWGGHDHASSSQTFLKTCMIHPRFLVIWSIRSLGHLFNGLHGEASFGVAGRGHWSLFSQDFINACFYIQVKELYSNLRFHAWELRCWLELGEAQYSPCHTIWWRAWRAWILRYSPWIILLISITQTKQHHIMTD